MFHQPSDLKTSQHRFLAFFLIFSLSFGLVSLLVTYASKASSVQAETYAAPLAPQVAQLEVAKEGPDSVFAGRVITYAIKITNNLGSQINNVVVTDTWAASENGTPVLAADFNGNYWVEPFDFVSAFTYTLPSPANRSGSAVWDLNPLPFDFEGTIEFTMTVPAALQPLDVSRSTSDVGPSVLGNSVGIRGDGVTVNDPDQVVTAIMGPVFNLVKSAETEPGIGPRPGRLITYTLSLNNLDRLDSTAATNIVIWEILPLGLIFEDAWAEVPGTTVEFDPVSRHITWRLASNFTLDPGEATAVTFVTRLPAPLDWKTKIKNEKNMCWVDSSELIDPVQCYNTLQINTLGIFDKTYVTEPSNLSSTKSYPNRYITYTVHVYNPLSQTVASNLRITDIMPSTWDFIEMVDGPNPVWPTPIGSVADTVVWHWPGAAIQPNGVMSFTWVAHIGPDTPVQELLCRGATYYNALAASADGFPIVYMYGRPFVSESGLAGITVDKQIKLDKSVNPSEQVASEVVTYTASLENRGDRTVNGIIFTDTLPIFFRYVNMVSGPAPASVVTQTLVWNVGTIVPGEKVQLVFRATADGAWQEKYPNLVNAYSPETSFCARSRASVRILSPLVFKKDAVPSQDSGDWVVQGEWFPYDVEYWNRSSIFDYTIDQFEDVLRDGFEVNGSLLYTTAIDPPFTLLTGEANSWQHTFQVDTPGYGSGTEWCDDLTVLAGYSDEDQNRVRYQDKGTFGVFLPDLDVWAVNGVKDGYMLFKPHVDMRQTLFPSKVGLSGTVEVTLSLNNNMRNYRGATSQAVNDIMVSYTFPSGFKFVDMIPPSPPPTIQTNDGLLWVDVDLPAGEGATAPLLHFQLEAPLATRRVKGRAISLPSNPSFCIPESEATYEVVSGVELIKRPIEDAVGPFGIVVYELALVNRTTAPVTGLTITDTLPPDFEFVGVLDGYPEPVTIDPLVWRGMSLGPDGASDDVIRIRYKVRASGLFGLYYNMVDGISDSTYVTRPGDYLDDVELAVLPGIALYKTASTDRAEAGQTLLYTVTLDNRSDNNIDGVRITDTLPLGFSFLEMVAGINPIATTPEVVWILLSRLDTGKKAELVFRAAVDTQIPSDRYCNQAIATAHVAGDSTAPVSIPDTDLAACVDVRGLPTVSRNKSVWPREVRAGELATYTITLFNETEQAQTLRLTDTLPVSVTFDSVVGSTPAPAQTSPVVWTNLQVGSQQTRTLVFRARVDLYARSGTYYNRLDAAIDGLTLSPKPNLAPLEVEEIPRYDLQITKSDGKVTADEGELLLYTITYTNVNQAALTLTDVVITDTFSPGPPYGNPEDVADWTPIAGDIFTHYVGDLDAGESGSVQFSLRLSDTIPTDIWIISNSVKIDHNTDAVAFETTPGNNQSTDIDILRGPDLVVTSVAVSPATPEAGEPILFEARVQNQGKDDALNAAGEPWFMVELYLKGTGFTPAGPPADVFDHVGGFWPDVGRSQERTSYMCTLHNMTAGDEQICTFNITDVEKLDDYHVYVQADVSFDDLTEEPWGHDYGTVLEAIESNNVYSFGVLEVGGQRTYLPIMSKNH